MVRIAIDINDVIRNYTGQFINCYRKLVNPKYEGTVEDIEDFNFAEAFDFKGETDYREFKYTDAAFELHARAEVMDNRLYGVLTDWTENVLKSLDVNEDPEVIFFSPFEMGLTIPSTLSFLAAHGIRSREYVFPVDSVRMYDRCDIMITANPNLISRCPEGKKVFKIEAPYNKDVETEYTFPSLYELIKDENETIVKIIEEMD